MKLRKKKIKLRKRTKEELIIEEEKLKRRSQWTEKLPGASPTSSDREVKVKLPKLEITKFIGTHLDWTRFWNQFSVKIGSSRLASLTKLSYLKEFLEPKIIDGLTFTSEGYNRAKSILEGKYGKPSKVANAHIQSIINLPYIGNVDLYKIHRFYEKLQTNVNSLDTVGKLREIKGYVRFTLDKLGGIRADLVRMDDSWQNWNFSEFIEALRKWTERNPITVTADRNKEHLQKGRMLQTLQKQWKTDACIYCGDLTHKAAECQRVKDVIQRRNILNKKKLCYNCNGEDHRAINCRSKRTCQHCKGKHHTSICKETKKRNKK